jgi:hypothetical protein
MKVRGCIGAGCKGCLQPILPAVHPTATPSLLSSPLLSSPPPPSLISPLPLPAALFEIIAAVTDALVQQAASNLAPEPEPEPEALLRRTLLEKLPLPVLPKELAALGGNWKGKGKGITLPLLNKDTKSILQPTDLSAALPNFVSQAQQSPELVAGLERAAIDVRNRQVGAAKQSCCLRVFKCVPVFLGWHGQPPNPRRSALEARLAEGMGTFMDGLSDVGDQLSRRFQTIAQDLVVGVQEVSVGRARMRGRDWVGLGSCVIIVTVLESHTRCPSWAHVVRLYVP